MYGCWPTKHPAEVLWIDLTVETQHLAQGADPSTLCLAPTGVVVLRRGGDLTDVVLRRSRAQLSDVQHA